MSNILFRSATELAEMIRKKNTSSLEVLEVHLEHIAKHNSKLNAVVTLDEVRAKQRAKEADAALADGEIWGPLHGVPITIKDAFETSGLKTTSSFKPLAGHIPKKDATVVERIKAAGAIIMGKTNMPTLALDIQSQSPLFGTANNPWDTSRTTGGSSGGSAAAIAAGFSPLEIGSDIGGSVRIPAHFCGVFSIKATENVISMAGHIPEPPGSPRGVRHMGVTGVLARSIEDLETVYPLLTGPDGKSWHVAPVPMVRVGESSLTELKLAWTDTFGSVKASQDTCDSLKEVVKNLSAAGCVVEKKNPANFDFTTVWQTWGEVLGAEIGSGMPAFHRFLASMSFKFLRDKSVHKRGFLKGLKMSLHNYAKLLTRRDGLISTLDDFLTGYDAWLCPVTAGPAFTHRKMGMPIEIDGQKISYFEASVGFTSVFNVSGNPSVVIPIGKSTEGMPIGMQIVGRHWTDMKLLSIAKAITKAAMPFNRPDGY